MDIQYKPSKPKKEKPVKIPKAPKAEKAVKFNSSIQAVKTSKPKKEKPVKAPKTEKAQSFAFGKPKSQTDKPMKVEKSKKPGFLSKIDPKLLIVGGLVLVVVVAVIMLTSVLPAIEEHGEEIKEITIAQLPTKTEYFVGEEASFEGLRILATKYNGETSTLRSGVCKISGFDSSVPTQSQTITVQYEGHTISFQISIVEKPKPVLILKSIELETLPNKLEYRLGDRLSTTGGVILCHYTDGSVSRVNLTNNNIYGFAEISAAGEYTLTVKYSENGRIAETTYTITVTE